MSKATDVAWPVITVPTPLSILAVPLAKTGVKVTRFTPLVLAVELDSDVIVGARKTSTSMFFVIAVPSALVTIKV